MRNNKDRADNWAGGHWYDHTVDETSKCSEPFCKYLLSWASWVTTSLSSHCPYQPWALYAPQPPWTSRGPEDPLPDQQLIDQLVNTRSKSRMELNAKSYSRMEQRKFPLAGEVWVLLNTYSITKDGTLEPSLKDWGHSSPDGFYRQSTTMARKSPT